MTAPPTSPAASPSDATPPAPAWAEGATSWTAFVHGLAAVSSMPGWVLTAGSVGFGALTRDMGLDLGLTLWISVLFFALPAQVVLADQLGRGASLFAAAFAVSLTAVRLLPMTVTIMPYLRDPQRRRWLELVAVHCIAVTAWIEGHQRLGPLRVELRLPHFIGFGSAFMGCILVGSSIGFLLAALVPKAVSAAMLFFTPAYFILSLLATTRTRGDGIAIGFGIVMGPLVYLLSPDLDLLVAGLVGGTIAYLSERGRGLA